MTQTTLDDSVATYVAGQDFRMLIGGTLTDGTGEARREVHDPSTGQLLTTVPSANPDDVATAVRAAQEAQPAWEAMGVDGRAACFATFAQLVRDNRERLAMLDAIDCGNPVKAMRLDIDLSDTYLRGWPALAKRLLRN